MVHGTGKKAETPAFDNGDVRRLLMTIGEDPEREGLQETPERFLRAWREWTRGYSQNPDEVLKCFKDGGEGYDEMVFEGPIQFYSHCEHHLTPFFGRAFIGYIPNGRIVGLSKLVRVTRIFSQRLQVQERLTDEVAKCLLKNLEPKGVGVVMIGRHLCMESRGAEAPGVETITSALYGPIKHDPAARSEFLRFVEIANAKGS